MRDSSLHGFQVLVVLFPGHQVLQFRLVADLDPCQPTRVFRAFVDDLRGIVQASLILTTLPETGE